MVTIGVYMQHLIQRNGWYFYDRRIPAKFTEFDSRKRVRLSLDTKCPKLARKRRDSINKDMERYWENLCAKRETHNKASFKELVKTARTLGYSYVPASLISEFPIEEIVNRLKATGQYLHNEDLVKATLGSIDTPKIRLSEVLKLYWDYSKPLTINKDANQLRKWRNPKIKAFNNLINLIDDIYISELTNKKLINLRDWWLERIKNEDIRPSSANKDFIHLKGIIETVCTHEEINIDTGKLFKKIRIKQHNSKPNNRAPFPDEFIRNTILTSKSLELLDDETRNMLYVSIETGARPIELLNLDGANDIILDNDIPHISIRPRKGYSLKTYHSRRKIPLVGKALDAFKKYPNGFKEFKGKPDQFSDYINKFFSKYGLKLTANHTYYSLRHSFQDRLTEHNIPDRIQCQLMGHSFKSKGRTQYGSGASLEHLQNVMRKIQLT